MALNADAGWVKRPSGEAATESDMETVLGNWAQLLICEEYRSGSNPSSLDNVVLTKE